MDRRTPEAVVAANVENARQERGISASTLADAAGIPSPTLSDRLSGASEFTWGELEDVGGVLSVSPVEFFVGVPRG
jgi:transcriptional regulator with XRE-family HTH domain